MISPGSDDQSPGVVVEAVALVPFRYHKPGMLKHASAIGEPHQMVKS